MTEPSGDGLYQIGAGDDCHTASGLDVLSEPAEGARPASDAVVVELRIADEEPLRSFLAAVGSAIGLFADVDTQDLPEAVRQGVAELWAACELLDVAVPARGAPGDPYRGVIIIEWPAAHGATPYSSMSGHMVSITDALTGKPIRTCTGVTVRVDMDSVVTADLTMFATEGGLPLLEGEPVLDGKEIRTGVFPFFVSEMRVQGR